MSSHDTTNTLQDLVRAIREILDPIARSVGDEAIRREVLLALGLDPAGAATGSVEIPPASLASIDSYRERNAQDADLQAFISVLADVTRVVQALIDFIESVANTGDHKPPGFEVEEAVSFFLESLVTSFLRVRQPGVYIAADALKLVEEQGIRFGGITQLLFRTGEFFEEFWGSASDLRTDEDAKRVSDVILFVLGVVVASLVEAEFVYGYDPGPVSGGDLADAASDRTLTLKVSGKTKDPSNNEVKGSIVLTTVLLPAEHGGPGFVTRIQPAASLEVPITSNLSFKFDAPVPDFIFYVPTGDRLPGHAAPEFPVSTDAAITVALIYKSKPTSEIIWGDANGVHLRIGSSKLEGSLGAKDQNFKFEIKDSAFVLATESTDGFLRTMLDQVTSDGKLETEFDFNFGYKKREWFVGGGMGLMMSLPLHETLLFLKFNTLTLGMAIGETAGSEPGVKVEASLSFGLDIGGVLQATVDRLGLAGHVAFESGDFTLHFKPPNGVGLAVRAGPVRGGGFLIFDFEREEYAGGLELEIAEIITVTALGLITTRLPDGSSGFSLLAILALEFGTPVQLGLGFTWNGIGGILGLNRTMRLEPMAEGIKSGAAERILFPRNIVANAAQIISDLRTFFPPQNDTFLIGGMLKIGWGTPSLMTLSLGVIVQIPPGTFAILGVLKVILPDEEAALLKLQVGFIGAYEPDRERAWFYATLYDSRVLFMTIEGGMGVLIAWGADSNFVISVGGFHPQFSPPPLPFPAPDRLAISILNQPFARIRVMAYFAVTSNTVQFGARAELFFGFDAVSVEGHLGLDALFQFSPFYFIVEISASVSLKVFGAGLFVVRMRGSLEGPTPWRLAGTASVKILFFSVSVDIAEVWGESADTLLPGSAVMPLLAEELGKEANWLARLPSANRLHVSLREHEPGADPLVLHPVGELVVSQRAVPLDVTVDKVGNQAATDATRFTLRVAAGSTLARRGDHDELFAMAQYQSMGDSEKLSKPAFQPVPGGIRLAVDGAQTRSSRMVKRRVRYETILIDTDFKKHINHFFAFWDRLFVHFVGGAAVTRLGISHKHTKEMQPFEDRIEVRAPAFTIATTVDNRAVAGAATFASEALASEHLRNRIAADPTQARHLHIIPSYEVNGSV